MPTWQALYRFGFHMLRKVYRFGFHMLRKVYRFGFHKLRKVYRFGFHKLRKVYRFGNRKLRKVYRVGNRKLRKVYRVGNRKLRKVYRVGSRNLQRVWRVSRSRFTHVGSLWKDYPKVLIVPGKFYAKHAYPGERPSVSVIMPFKNRKKFLTEAIESALDSKHVDVELILVDDGSDDGSSEIARQFSEGSDKVVYVRMPQSLGAYVARNIGILAASGEYLAFLDSDDTHSPMRLIEQIQVLKRNPEIRLTITGANRFLQNFEGTPIHRVRFASISMVFHQSLITEQGYFDSVKFGGDSEFLHRVLRNFPAPAIALLKPPHYAIRLSEGSLTTAGEGSFYPTGDLNHRASFPTSREEYTVAFQNAHKQSGSFFVPFPQTERLIPLGDSQNIVLVPELGELLP